MGMKMKKGLAKGLKYFNQFWEEEQQEEDEIQIGLPTDVKHVAHIGWDGPSANSTPSWMSEFKAENKDDQSEGNEDANKGTETGTSASGEVSSRKANKNRDRELPPIKGNRRQPSVDSLSETGSPTASPTRRSKDKSNRRRSSGSKTQKDSLSSPRGEGGDESVSNLPNIPKKSRRKKSKEDESVRSRKVNNESGSPKMTRRRHKKGAANLSEDGSSKLYGSEDGDANGSPQAW